MNIRKWALLSSLLCCSTAFALTPEQEAERNRLRDVIQQGYEVMKDADARGMPRCDVQKIVVSKPEWDTASKTGKNIDVTLTFDWSGGCVNGLRDGEGVLTRVEESTKTTPLLSGGVHTAHNVVTMMSQGRFVKGQRLGLWCTERKSRLTQSGDDKAFETNNTSCTVFGGSATGLFQKQADGSWRELNGSTTLNPGALEALSAQVLAAAAGGAGVQPAAPVALVGQNQMLDDLVAGARIVLAPSKEKIDLQGKRVAVVLSSATITEMERFRREREALINASAGLTGNAAQHRARFIAASEPERLLVNVAKVMRTKNAGSVQAADDLSGLQQGRFDYALVIDWKPKARFDLLGKFDTLPVAKLNATQSAQQDSSSPSVVACSSFGFFVIDSKLKAIGSHGLQRFDCSSKHEYTARGDEGYMQVLADRFEYSMGKSVDDVGEMKLLAYRFTP